MALSFGHSILSDLDGWSFHLPFRFSCDSITSAPVHGLSFGGVLERFLDVLSSGSNTSVGRGRLTLSRSFGDLFIQDPFSIRFQYHNLVRLLCLSSLSTLRSHALLTLTFFCMLLSLDAFQYLLGNNPLSQFRP